MLDGVRLDPWPLDAVMARVERACLARQALQIITVNVNFLTLARRKPFFRAVLDGAGLAVVDGRILLWMLRLSGVSAPAQVTGHDLLRAGVELAARQGFRVWLLGGGPGVAFELAADLRTRYPGLCVAGTDGGRFSETGESTDDAALLAEMRSFAPHLVFVALGAPKQDAWIARNLSTIGAVAVGVGGVFDTRTGRLPRAPRWMQLAGLESLFQLAIDPRRYARRYLRDDPPTLLRLLRIALAARARRGR